MCFGNCASLPFLFRIKKKTCRSKHETSGCRVQSCGNIMERRVTFISKTNLWIFWLFSFKSHSTSHSCFTTTSIGARCFSAKYHCSILLNDVLNGVTHQAIPPHQHWYRRRRSQNWKRWNSWVFFSKASFFSACCSTSLFIIFYAGWRWTNGKHLNLYYNVPPTVMEACSLCRSIS